MKTQLLEDLEESGSAPAPGSVEPAPAARPLTPRRRAVADLLLQRAADAEGFDAARSRQRAPEGNWSGAHLQPAPDLKRSGGTDPVAAVAAEHAPSPPTHEPIFTHPEMPVSPALDTGPAAPEDVAATDDLPAWLGERLREDEQREAAHERRLRWTRRVLAGAAAAALLALLAGGGWWMVRENRVDGALSLVANTSPSPQTAAPPARAGTQAPTSTQAGASTQAGVPDGAPASDSEAPGPTAAAAAKPSDAATAAEASASDEAGQQALVPRHRRKASASAPASASSQAPRTKAGAEAGAAHRREETLLQCRALGYDEAQCRRRGCAMTRFGLACRG